MVQKQSQKAGGRVCVCVCLRPIASQNGTQKTMGECLPKSCCCPRFSPTIPPTPIPRVLHPPPPPPPHSPHPSTSFSHIRYHLLPFPPPSQPISPFRHAGYICPIATFATIYYRQYYHIIIINYLALTFENYTCYEQTLSLIHKCIRKIYLLASHRCVYALSLSELWSVLAVVIWWWQQR